MEDEIDFEHGSMDVWRSHRHKHHIVHNRMMDTSHSLRSPAAQKQDPYSRIDRFGVLRIDPAFCSSLGIIREAK